MITTDCTPQQIANEAVKHMLAQTNMPVQHAPGWQRPTNWPLPVKKVAPDADGFTRQHYRPIVVLEYVNDMLSRKPCEGDSL